VGAVSEGRGGDYDSTSFRVPSPWIGAALWIATGADAGLQVLSGSNFFFRASPTANSQAAHFLAPGHLICIGEAHRQSPPKYARFECPEGHHLLRANVRTDGSFTNGGLFRMRG